MRLRRLKLVLLGLCLFGMVASWAIATWVFPLYSSHHDETIYLEQAGWLKQGQFFQKETKLTEFFIGFAQKVKDGKVFFKYLPGQAALLAISEVLFGTPRVFSVFFSGLNIYLVFMLACLVGFSHRTALASSLLFALTPMVLIQSATLLIYPTLLTFLLLSLVLLLKALKVRSKTWAGLAGISWGFLFFLRPFEAVLAGVPVLIHWWLRYRKRKNISVEVCFFLGLLPWIVAVGCINKYFLGSYFQMLFSYDSADTFGFGEKQIYIWEPVLDFTPSLSFHTEMRMLSLLVSYSAGGYLLYSLFGYAFITRRRWNPMLLWLLLVIPIGYFFFWAPANALQWGAPYRLGPYYYLPMCLPISIFGGRFLTLIAGRKPVLRFLVIVLLVAASIPTLYESIRTHLRYTQKKKNIVATLEPLKTTPSLVFLPNYSGPFLNHPLNLFSNVVRTPDDKRVYSVNRGNHNFRLMDARPDLTPYRYNLVGRYTEGATQNYKATLVPIVRQAKPYWDLEFEAVNTSDEPKVFAFYFRFGEMRSFLLDGKSKRGKTYRMTWRVTADSVRFMSPSLWSNSNQSDRIPDFAPLRLGVFFGKALAKDTGFAYEFRIPFQKAKEGVELLLPPEEWVTKEFPNGFWAHRDISATLKWIPGDSVPPT